MVKEKVLRQGEASNSIPIGWQGLQFELPANWNFTAEAGSQKEGFIRISSPHSNMELKWGKITHPRKFPPESVKAKLFEKLKKSDRKLEVSGEKSSKILGHDCIYFDLKSNYQGKGVIWFCEEIRRMFIIILTAQPDHFRQATLDFDRLLDSLRCHSLQAWPSWGVFGFSFRAPSTFELKERKFLVGHGSVVLSTLETHLLDKEETQALLQYWGVANVNFENESSDMKLWFADFYEKELRKRYGRKTKEGRFRRIDVSGHPAVMLNAIFKRGVVNTRTNQSGICMWSCPNTNRIYALTLSRIAYKKLYVPSRRSVQFPSKMFKEMIASVRCH